MAQRRALASHRCGPGSIPGLGVTCELSLLLVLVLAPRGFSSGTPVFPSPQNQTFRNSNSIRNLRATGLSVITDSYYKCYFIEKRNYDIFAYRRMSSNTSLDCRIGISFFSPLVARTLPIDRVKTTTTTTPTKKSNELQH